MNTKEAWALVGGLSKPSKMPGWSIGIPAAECRTGKKLQLIPDSVCYNCYALKGCYVFKVVQQAQYRRLAAIKDPQWVDRWKDCTVSSLAGLMPIGEYRDLVDRIVTLAGEDFDRRAK